MLHIHHLRQLRLQTVTSLRSLYQLVRSLRSLNLSLIIFLLQLTVPIQPLHPLRLQTVRSLRSLYQPVGLLRSQYLHCIILSYSGCHTFTTSTPETSNSYIIEIIVSTSEIIEIFKFTSYYSLLQRTVPIQPLHPLRLQTVKLLGSLCSFHSWLYSVWWQLATSLLYTGQLYTTSGLKTNK